MNTPLFSEINNLARATPWLNAPMVGYAEYGVVLFALLLLTGWWTARQRGAGLPADPPATDPAAPARL